MGGMKSVVSTKGQVTLPVEVRAKLGLTVGTAVQFELREGGVLLRKGGGALHPVDRVFGRLKLDRPVDTLLDEMRGSRPAGKGLGGGRPAGGEDGGRLVRLAGCPRGGFPLRRAVARSVARRI
jgi:AbrB family looped-hinge helix DNA binding protein